MSVRVTAPARLHLGLIHVPVPGFTHWPDGRVVPRFGGLGLMLEEPAIRVAVSRSDTWRAEGSLGGRAEAFARIVVGDRFPLQVVADGPDEHTGLGVGTALGLSLAAACRRLVNATGDTVQDLAALVGRGRRSGIGMYGFQAGGFIVDGGRVGDEPPRLTERLEFPTGWRIVLVRPCEPGRWHGDRERSAFQRPRSAEQARHSVQRLQSLTGVVADAVRAGRFDDFAAAVGEFNLLAGEPFRADQAGCYTGPAVSAVVQFLRDRGHAGVGQSSWGPTVFCFTRGVREAESLAAQLTLAFPADTAIRVVRAANRGAALTEDEADRTDEEHVGGQHEE